MIISCRLSTLSSSRRSFFSSSENSCNSVYETWFWEALVKRPGPVAYCQVQSPTMSCFSFLRDSVLKSINLIFFSSSSQMDCDRSNNIRLKRKKKHGSQSTLWTCDNVKILKVKLPRIKHWCDLTPPCEQTQTESP